MLNMIAVLVVIVCAFVLVIMAKKSPDAEYYRRIGEERKIEKMRIKKVKRLAAKKQMGEKILAEIKKQLDISARKSWYIVTGDWEEQVGTYFVSIRPTQKSCDQRSFVVIVRSNTVTTKCLDNDKTIFFSNRFWEGKKFAERHLTWTLFDVPPY